MPGFGWLDCGQIADPEISRFPITSGKTLPETLNTNGKKKTGTKTVPVS
jgi:hypothetical protein